MKVGKILTHAVIIALLLAILYQLAMPRSTFVGTLEPREMTIKGTGKEPSRFGDLRPSLACVPGPEKESSYYTMGLTPGGLCGDQDFVVTQMRDYSITDGIGGSLLDRT
jgi:hypothetical protein